MRTIIVIFTERKVSPNKIPSYKRSWRSFIIFKKYD